MEMHLTLYEAASTAKATFACDGEKQDRSSEIREDFGIEFGRNAHTFRYRL